LALWPGHFESKALPTYPNFLTAVTNIGSAVTTIVYESQCSSEPLWGHAPNGNREKSHKRDKCPIHVMEKHRWMIWVLIISYEKPRKWFVVSLCRSKLQSPLMHSSQYKFSLTWIKMTSHKVFFTVKSHTVVRYTVKCNLNLPSYEKYSRFSRNSQIKIRILCRSVIKCCV